MLGRLRKLLGIISLTLTILLIVAMITFSIVNVEVRDEVPSIEKEGDVRVVALISDTHIPSRTKRLPDRVFEVFRDADVIIHAGDLTQIEVVRELEKVAPVVAVHGNMDPYEIRVELPEMDSVEVYGWKIGIIHDPGALWGMGEMKRIAKENGFDVLVFGHTHRQFVKWEDDVLYVNPGSPTNPLPPMLVKPSVGLLFITEESVEPLIIKA